MTDIKSRTVVTTTHIATIDGQEVETTAPVAEYIDPYISEDGKTVVVALVDTDGSTLDSQYEWPEGVEFIQSNNRNFNYCDDPDAWISEQTAAGKKLFPVGVYDHSGVSYTLAGESMHSGDKWDYVVGAVIAIPAGPGEFTDPESAARNILNEYTAWCNGDGYGIARLEREVTYDLAGHEVLGDWKETDVVWGFLGSEYTQDVLNEGGY